MDDFETEEEYDVPPTKNVNMVDMGNDDNINGEHDIGQHGEPGSIHTDPMMVLSQQFNIDVMRHQEVTNKALNDTHELYIGQKFNANRSM